MPRTTIGMLWPGIACGLPSTYLPMRGPMHDRRRPGAMMPPIACTTPEPAKSTAPWPRPQFMPDLRQPAAAPDPVGVEAVGQRHPQAEQAEVLPRPAFRHRAGGNRGGRVHEHHHEEEQRHDADVVQAVQEEALRAEQAVL